MLDLSFIHQYNMEASEPKCVNPALNIIGVNSLWLGGLHFIHALGDAIFPKWYPIENYIY